MLYHLNPMTKISSRSSDQCDFGLEMSSLKSHPRLLPCKTQHMSISYTYTEYLDHNKIYNLLSSITIKGIGQRKMVCNPTRQAGSPT
jgi:hypothetical protein